MESYSIKDVAEILKDTVGKNFTADGIRKMVKRGKLPQGLTAKKLGWQIIIFAESPEKIIELFNTKFQRSKE
jgi:hypothetical protein